MWGLAIRLGVSIKGKFRVLKGVNGFLGHSLDN